VTKRFYIVVFILLAVVLSAFVWQMLRPRENEPVYQGKTLSQWLDAWDQGGPSHPDAAIEAVRKMGTNALTYLIRDIRAKDGLVWRKLPDSAYKFHLIRSIRRHVSGPDAVYRRERAAVILTILGPAAAPAIPDLSDCLDETNTAMHAANILGHYDSIGRVALGPEAVPALLKAITNSDARVRGTAANALGLLASEPDVVVPSLLHALKDSSPEVRAMAARSFGGYKMEAATILPPLIQILDDSNPRVRQSTVWMLGRFRSLASNAVPKLSVLLNDPDDKVRNEATNALKLIVPESAK